MNMNLHPADAATSALDPEAVVQRQLDAFNARDVAAILATYAPEAAQWEHPATLLARGTEQLHERFAARFQEPNLHATLNRRIVIDHETVTRTFPEGTGRIELVAIYEVAQGRIAQAWFLFGAKRLDP